MATPNPIIMGTSKCMIDFGESNGWTIDAIPNTDRMLNILEPIILPMDMELSFRYAAIADVANSGREVPNATTLIPMVISEIPNNRAS